ncbi:MAG: DUF1295 domain-containing protein [Candidatus Heimdallarchaeota archaeon]|nr:DUF1295 domain-containing protein [Candidatus Heimdallarchaeota archaeon]MCK4609872.1 DUF1295 domain-containing protein [Candidatus Heimdallarchaeota archaeon]
MNMSTSQLEFSRLTSFVICIISYVVALGAAVGVLFGINGLVHPLLATLIADVAATLVIYIISTIFKNTSLYDPYWSVIPIIIIFYWIISIAPVIGFRSTHIWIMVVVGVWGVRLTYNWARGWKGLHHEDWRYTNYRKNYPKLFWFINLTGLHLMPTLVVYAGCLSLYPAIISPTLETMNIFFWLGLMICIGAIILEAVADEQLKIFNDKKKERELLIRGLWATSRHPNYLGEVGFWWGIYFFSLAADFSYWWTIVGPLVVTLLFVVISIPLIEKKMLKKYPTYKIYKKKVPMLIPWFKRKKT